MSALRLEVRTPGSEWRQLALLSPGDREGSVSHAPLGGTRDVIMFACHGDHSMIRRSAAGADYETGTARVIATVGMIELARLRDGGTFEMDVISDRGIKYRARWTHTQGS